MKPRTTCCPWLHRAFIVLPLLVSISLDYNYKVERAAGRQRGLLIIAELNQLFHTVPVYLYVASHVTDTMKSHVIMNAEYSLKKLLLFAI